jgi:type II secretory pathway pseudopilin PulG
MNSERGFTIVEIIVVLGIMFILLSLATRGWNRMSMKAAVEGQVKTVFADLMNVRTEALYTKRARSVVFSGKAFMVYSSQLTSVSPILTKNHTYDFIPAGTNTITFDTSGMATSDLVTVCVAPGGLSETNGAVDSLVVSSSRINLGKRTAGADCGASYIVQK